MLVPNPHPALCATFSRREKEQTWNALEQFLLHRGSAWRHEAAAIEREIAPLVDAVFAAGQREPLPDQVGELPFAAHARTEARVVVLATAHLADQAHHVLRTLGYVQFKPFAE